MGARLAASCVFCEILRGEKSAPVVLDDAAVLAILDHRPLFPGHVLVLPRRHAQTLGELGAEEVTSLFGRVQLLARAVEEAMGAEGSFVALNNRVSQSVPHLHVHVVPRRKGDGLRGFFWPRRRYDDAAHAEEVRSRVAKAVERLRKC